MVLLLYKKIVPELSRVVDSSRWTVISSGRSELREVGGDICSCIISAVGLGSKAAVQ